MNTVVSRFAPSPTGYLHIGGIRIAMLNYIVTTQAKINYPDSKFLLRIEDTDKIRSNKKYIDSIITGLEWLGTNFAATGLPFWGAKLCLGIATVS